MGEFSLNGKSRSQLLLNAGVKFSVRAPNVDERKIKTKLSGKPVEAIARKLAELKACKISESHPKAFVIGADQMLDCGGNVFDKPKNYNNAVSHLKAMRGKTHRLTAAVCVVQNEKILWKFTSYYIKIYFLLFINSTRSKNNKVLTKNS